MVCWPVGPGRYPSRAERPAPRIASPFPRFRYQPVVRPCPNPYTSCWRQIWAIYYVECIVYARQTARRSRAKAILDPFPRDGQRGVSERGAARIESRDGEVLSSRTNARAAFIGRSGLRRNLRWDALDSVYFAGYAMWNYLTFPYLLTRQGVEVGEGETCTEGESGDSLLRGKDGRLLNGGRLSGERVPICMLRNSRILSQPVVTGAVTTRSGSRRLRPRLRPRRRRLLPPGQRRRRRALPVPLRRFRGWPMTSAAPG